MTYATLTGTTVTLTFPLAAAEGLRHAIAVVAPQRPTSEREELWQVWGALVNPQPPRAAPRPENERRDGMRGLREVAVRQARPEPVDVMAVLDRLMSSPCDACNGDCGSANPPVIGCPQREAIEARATIAELIEAANRAHMALIGYLPAHRNAVTDEAIAKVSAALAHVGSAGGAL